MVLLYTLLLLIGPGNVNYFEEGTANLPRKIATSKNYSTRFFSFLFKANIKRGSTPKIKNRQLSVFVMQSKIISHSTPEILRDKTKDNKLDAHSQIPIDNKQIIPEKFGHYYFEIPQQNSIKVPKVLG